MDETKAWYYFIQILRGISYLNQNYINHLDLHAGNILFSSDKRAIINDFGLSKPIRNPSASIAEIATFNYLVAPPEVLKTGKAGRKFDTWSCGILLYRMLHEG